MKVAEAIIDVKKEKVKSESSSPKVETYGDETEVVQKALQKVFYHFVILQTNASEEDALAAAQESKEQLVDTLDNELLPEEEEPKELNGETKN